MGYEGSTPPAVDNIVDLSEFSNGRATRARGDPICPTPHPSPLFLIGAQIPPRTIPRFSRSSLSLPPLFLRGVIRPHTHTSPPQKSRALLVDRDRARR